MTDSVDLMALGAGGEVIAEYRASVVPPYGTLGNWGTAHVEVAGRTYPTTTDWPVDNPVKDVYETHAEGLWQAILDATPFRVGTRVRLVDDHEIATSVIDNRPQVFPKGMDGVVVHEMGWSQGAVEVDFQAHSLVPVGPWIWSIPLSMLEECPES